MCSAISLENLKKLKYGNLRIIDEISPHVYPSGRKARRMKCQCDCGNFVNIVLMHLRSEHTKTCGCTMEHHGLRYHPLYKIWLGIKSRCYIPNATGYKNYGGRGIAVCDNWIKSFKSFYDWCINNNWKKGLQIDRIDNEGSYCPINCRVVSNTENVRNSRVAKYNMDRVNKIRILYSASNCTKKDFAIENNINISTLKDILNYRTWGT